MKELDGVPFDKEVEQQLLCSLIAGPDYIFRVALDVLPSFFLNPEYRAIYCKLLLKSQKGEDIDELTFADGESDDRQHIIRELFDNAITGTTAPHWAKKVREYAYARSIYELGNTLCEQASALESFEEADLFLRVNLDAVLSKFNVGIDDTYDPKAIGDICQEIQNKRHNPGIHGIKTLFPIFDRVVKGLKLLNLVSAPSGFGKTALGLQWAWNIGVKQRIPTLYLNYEMGEDELTERLLACGSGVELDDIQLGETDDEQNEQVTNARAALMDGKLFITGCEDKTIDNTLNLIFQFSSQYHIKCVFVDYIGEIGKTENEYSQHTYALYGDWLQKIKGACAKLGIKAVILAQLNREGYKGAPGMENIGDSMQLIHKSHVAIGLYEAKDGHPNMKIFKNRGGAIVQPIPLRFNKECQQLKEY